MIPLDERPVNTRYPQTLASIAGLELHLPPGAVLGRAKSPADTSAIAAWLVEEVNSGTQAAFVCAETLGYGNLINSRISSDSAAAVIGRLSILEKIGKSVPVHGFSIITRAANANDCVEEPLYWKEWGTRCHLYSKMAHKALAGEIQGGSDEAEEFRKLEAQIPSEVRNDWLLRRLRNHTVNLAILEMTARGSIASLRLTSDDTSEFGLSARERDWIATWPDLVGEGLSGRVRMHPGADEVGSALVAWWLNSARKQAPRVWIDYAIDADSDLIAPYEDVPVNQTVLGQLLSCGCVPATTPAESDIVLGVVTPSPRLTDYRLDFLNDDRWDRSEAYHQQLNRLARLQQLGKQIAIADVAYPNGADPLYSEILMGSECTLKLGELAAYGAWNTAGNTLGVVIAQASCVLAMGTQPESERAQRVFLAHRFLEDDGYQSVVRRAVREEAKAKWGRQDPDPDNATEVAWVCSQIEAKLASRLTALKALGVGVGLTIRKGSVSLPWNRTFEVDFDLIESTEQS
jgi:hypothetical protein